MNASKNSELEIWAAVPTPFGADGELDLAVVPDQAARLIADGVTGVFVAGTTGEFPSLSPEERMLLAETWAKVRGSLVLGVHVGDTDVRRSAALAAHAQEHDAGLIATVAPYYGPQSMPGTVDFLERVAAAAAHTPFCFYHFPGMTGSTLRARDIVVAARPRISTLSAVKFTDEDLSEFGVVRTLGVDAFFGRDELLPAAIAVGAEKVIGSLYNVLTPVAKRVHETLRTGELAEAYRLHEPFRLIAEDAGRHGGPAFVKCLLGLLGPNTGASRTPWGPLSAEGADAARILASRLRPLL